ILTHIGPHGALSMFTLTAVAISAWRGGLKPALLASLGGTAAGSPFSPIVAEGLLDSMSMIDLELLVVPTLLVAVLVARLGSERRRADRIAGLIGRLLAVSDAALTHPDLDDLLEQLLDRIMGVLEVDAAAFLVREGGGDVLLVRAVKGVPEWPPR